MNTFKVSSELLDLPLELNHLKKELMTRGKKAVRKVALKSRNEARQNFVSNGIGNSRTTRATRGDKTKYLYKDIRTKNYDERQNLGLHVYASTLTIASKPRNAKGNKAFVLKFFEYGTKDRYTKKGRYRNKITARPFFNSVANSEENKFYSYLTSELNKVELPNIKKFSSIKDLKTSDIIEHENILNKIKGEK